MPSTKTFSPATTPQEPIPVTLVDPGTNKALSQGASFYNTAANTAGYQVKSGAGVLHGLTINTPGLTSSATFYDHVGAGGTKIAGVSTLAQGALTFDIAFANGLWLVLAGGTPADVTVAYW